MDLNSYGPFASVVAFAGVLVLVFGHLLLRMLGDINRWTWLISDSPSFLVMAGPRAFAVALMAGTYITINSSNYVWFIIAAIVSGILCFISIMRFDYLRKLYVAPVPLVGPNGDQLRNKRGTPLSKNVVIGAEERLRPEAVAAFEKARAEKGISLRAFMGGYGSPVNDPEALWDRDYLAGIANKLTASLMYVILLAVMTLFLAAFVLEVAGRSSS